MPIRNLPAYGRYRRDHPIARNANEERRRHAALQVIKESEINRLLLWKKPKFEATTKEIMVRIGNAWFIVASSKKREGTPFRKKGYFFRTKKLAEAFWERRLGEIVEWAKTTAQKK